MSNEIAPKNVFEIVQHQQHSFNEVLSSDAVTWAKESQFAIQQLQKNDFLNKTAWSNQESLRNAIVNVASIGISLNPANKHAYLVPRDKMVCLDISYMGLKHLAESSGSIEWMQAKIVYENDVYINKGVDKAPQHDQKTFGEKGGIVGAYCTVKLPNGDYLTEEMDIHALYEIRSKSKAFTSGKPCPWVDFEKEMMRKTVVKRAAKYWPSPKNETNRVNQAIDVINEHEGLEEPELYTEEEQKEFMRMINDKLAFSLSAYMSSCSDEKQTGLFNSFPKGEVSSGKKKVRELTSIGRVEWEDFTLNIRGLIEAEDTTGLQSELKGFELYEKQMLAGLLGEPDTTTLATLLKGANNG